MNIPLLSWPTRARFAATVAMIGVLSHRLFDNQSGNVVLRRLALRAGSTPTPFPVVLLRLNLPLPAWKP